MRYMIARHEMVEDFLTAIFEHAKIFLSDNETRSLKRIALVEGVDYD